MRTRLGREPVVRRGGDQQGPLASVKYREAREGRVEPGNKSVLNADVRLGQIQGATLSSPGR